MFRKVKRILGQKYLKSILKIQRAGSMMVQCGNAYGGFEVVKDVLDEINIKRKLIVYSFGIGEDLSFSEAVYEKWNCDIYAFDPTPKSIKYVHSSKMYEQEGFHFYEWGVGGVKTGFKNFMYPIMMFMYPKI